MRKVELRMNKKIWSYQRTS